jgi:hypothetical protein
MIYDPSALLHMNLAHLGIPVVGLSFTGTTFIVTYDPSATAGQIAQGNQIASTWPTYNQQTRPITAIYTDVRALSASQKNNITGPSGDLYSGTPMKALLDVGVNQTIIAALLTVRQCSFCSAAADRQLIDNQVTALYTADNPYYLSAPSFDSTINVTALEPA